MTPRLPCPERNWRNNSCTWEEVNFQYRPASEFLFFPLVWVGRSVLMIKAV